MNCARMASYFYGLEIVVKFHCVLVYCIIRMRKDFLKSDTKSNNNAVFNRIIAAIVTPHSNSSRTRSRLKSYTPHTDRSCSQNWIETKVEFCPSVLNNLHKKAKHDIEHEIEFKVICSNLDVVKAV